jgi:stage III sporulation protein AB
MIQFFGALLLAGGATALGLGAANQLGARTNTLRAMCDALQMMERELSFRLTPMPELLNRVAKGASPPAAAFFNACAKELSTSTPLTMSAIWDCALGEKLPDLSAEDRRILCPLGNILGRFDVDCQREALSAAIQELERAKLQAEEIHRRQGKVYSILGLVSGAFFVILLI